MEETLPPSHNTRRAVTTAAKAITRLKLKELFICRSSFATPTAARAAPRWQHLLD